MYLDKLIQTAKEKINKDKAIDVILSNLSKIADVNTPGSTLDFGQPIDQEYANEASRGEDIGGENNPDKGDMTRTGPRDSFNKEAEECVKCHKNKDLRGKICGDCAGLTTEASSNKPCKDCGMPTDKCICMEFNTKDFSNKPNNIKTQQKPQKGMDPTKKAHFNNFVSLLKRASHIEEIEIPLKEFKLDNKFDLNSSVLAEEHVHPMIQMYLRKHVYPGPNIEFSIARVVQENNKFFVNILVFDNQLSHVANNVTNNKVLNKVSNEQVIKTAWKRRVSIVLI